MLTHCNREMSTQKIITQIYIGCIHQISCVYTRCELIFLSVTYHHNLPMPFGILPVSLLNENRNKSHFTNAPNTKGYDYITSLQKWCKTLPIVSGIVPVKELSEKSNPTKFFKFPKVFICYNQR